MQYRGRPRTLLGKCNGRRIFASPTFSLVSLRVPLSSSVTAAYERDELVKITQETHGRLCRALDERLESSILGMLRKLDVRAASFLLLENWFFFCLAMVCALECA